VKNTTILAVAGVILVGLLFLFGRTTEKKVSQPVLPEKKTDNFFDITNFVNFFRDSISPARQSYLSTLEKDTITTELPVKIAGYNKLAGFWKDSIHSFEAYAHYTGEAAKLDNSEKNLTFAARLFLDNLRIEQDESKLNWETAEAISLFERAIEINPGNDDLRIGVGSAYIFGKGRSGDPQETMKGVQQLLAVVRKDPANMKAQLVLGIGGFVSGQYDKALERLKKVVEAEPGNLEAIAFLADTYAAKGDKTEAVKWYNISKRLANDPHYSKEVDARLQQLR
jgi:tetratricopeptide (TPR) repeat protein